MSTKFARNINDLSLYGKRPIRPVSREELKMERYYLTQNGKPVGPWSLDQIMNHLKSNELSWTDYLYDEARHDWVLLMDHPSLMSYFREVAHTPAPKAPAKAEKVEKKSKDVELNKEKEWFTLKGDNKYGPFTYLEVMKSLQQGEIHEFDYVWNVRFTNWKRVSECEEFQPEKVRALRESGHPEIEEVFFRRRHARAAYGASLLVHNNRQVWRAESLEISPGGCGLMVDHPELEPGQSLFLHFKAGDGVPPFNAICQVVSKQTPQPGQKWVRYGVKFTSISRQIQLAIKDFTAKAA